MQYVSRGQPQHGAPPDPQGIIDMCDACALFELFPAGREAVVSEITELLMAPIRHKFPPVKALAGAEALRRVQGAAAAV